jgi:hypothetical protein
MLDARRFQSIEIRSLLVQLINLNTENNDADDVFSQALIISRPSGNFGYLIRINQ